jgi:enoyl-CoA hydratase/carnithine racemase
MTEATLLVDVVDRVAVLTLNRPQRLNALNEEIQLELLRVLESINENDDIFGVIITGSGKAFCAGGDLKERLENFKADSTIYGDAMLSRLRRICNLLEEMGKPIIAAINGFAYGGGVELALACDIRIASETAKLGLVEPKVGMIPGAGGTQRLPRLIGSALAKELLFTAGTITATEAYQMGLVNRVVTDGETVLEAAREMMDRITKNAPLAVRMSKFAVNKGMQMSLSEGLDFEASCTAFLRTTQDRVEGITAFQEKRQSNFRGK